MDNEETACIVVNRKHDMVRVYFNGSLLYVSSFIKIVSRNNNKINFAYFILSEICEYYSDICEYEFEFIKAFMYFAKEFCNGNDCNR